MVNYLMASVNYAWNFLHKWVRRIQYNDCGEGILTSFAWPIFEGKGLQASIGS
jgi:hypothetical protein